MNSARILVVDDNPTNLKLVSELLELEGYEILKAIDAEMALEIVERTPPALILMDIALPGMDGLTLTRQLKADERTRDIIIVALTAFAMKGDDRKAYAAGCDGYITKPINTRALPDVVARYLGPAETGESPPAGLKVLVVEDHPPQLKLAHHVLSAAGHDVSGAESAARALTSIKENRPQIILLDLSLPGTDGLALARILKTDPETRDIHLIAVTSFPEEYTRARALNAGCDGYITKPLDTRSLPGQLEAAATSIPVV